MIIRLVYFQPLGTNQQITQEEHKKNNNNNNQTKTKTKKKKVFLLGNYYFV